MIERELRFPTGKGLTLAGTVALPDPPAPSGGWPGLVLVLGSYPATRDGDLDHRQGWFSPDAPRRSLFRFLAHALAERGVATLRHDKRGCGESEGDFDDVDFEALVEDASAAVTALSTVPEVSAERIGLLGQSEGGVIVLEAARRDARVAAVLAQGSPGRGLLETRSDEADQLVAAVDALPPDARRAFIGAMPGAYLFMKSAEAMREAIARGDHRLLMEEEGHRITLNLDWIRQHLAHPADEIAAQLRVPVAFFAGELDRNVHPDNARHLAEVSRAAGNPSVTLRVFPGIDHGMRPGSEDVEGGLTAMASAEFTARPVDPEYLEAVAEWTLSTLGSRDGPAT